tara:strand:- start:649 stop:1608 length:960 start_codon:yes stop_codon:yes gene_type:complete
MKFLLSILLIYFLLIGKSFSKILNIDDFVNLEVPNNYDYKKIENSSAFQDDLDFLDEFGISLYVVGSKNVINFFDKFFKGQDIDKEDWILELVSKIEKKASKTNSRKALVSYAKKVIKKTFINYDLNLWTIVLVADKPFQNSELEAELIKVLQEDGIFNNLYNLSSSDLKKIQNIINKEIKKNSTFVADQNITYKFNPLKVSKDKFSDIFISGKVSISAAIWDELKFSYSGKYYFTLKNDIIFGVYQECIFKCSNFNETFKKTIKPISSISSNKKLGNEKNLDLNDENLVENLEKLNDLYKSGVLTKEEFEKAKKKILN